MEDLSQVGLLEPSVAAVLLALARARAASARMALAREVGLGRIGRIATLTEPCSKRRVAWVAQRVMGAYHCPSW